MINHLSNFITIIILIILLFCYNYILYSLVRKPLPFSLRITDKLVVVIRVIIIILGILYVYYILSIRIARMGFYFNTYEIFHILKESITVTFYTALSHDIIYVVYPILIIILALGILLFWMLVISTLTKLLKYSFTALYLYFWQFKSFSVFMFLFSARLSQFDYILYTQLKGILPFRVINKIDMYSKRCIWMLESFIYRGLAIYAIYYDFMINYGNISLLFYIMPSLYMYTIIKNSLIFMKTLLDNPEFFEISDKMYKNLNN